VPKGCLLCHFKLVGAAWIGGWNEGSVACIDEILVRVCGKQRKWQHICQLRSPCMPSRAVLGQCRVLMLCAKPAQASQIKQPATQRLLRTQVFLNSLTHAALACGAACCICTHLPCPAPACRSFIALWLLMLPFGFIATLGPWTIPFCIIVGYQILGFEDIGVEIESPFGYDYNDLPVDVLQAQIFNNMINCLTRISAVKELHGDVKEDTKEPEADMSNYGFADMMGDGCSGGSAVTGIE
jgi:hypothetical protein